MTGTSVFVFAVLLAGINIANTQVPGAPQPIATDDPDVQKYIELGFRKFADDFTGPNDPILVKVKSATVQVVAGTITKITVHIGTSTCEKGKTDNCELKADEDVKECIISVFSQPWTNTQDITTECSEEKIKNE